MKNLETKLITVQSWDEDNGDHVIEISAATPFGKQYHYKEVISNHELKIVHSAEIFKAYMEERTMDKFLTDLRKASKCDTPS